MPRALAAVALVFAAAGPVAADPAGEEVRAKVRAAVGYDAWRKLDHGAVLDGSAETFGVAGTFRLHLHPDGRYALAIDSRAGLGYGFDGKQRWGRLFTNPPLPADLADADAHRFQFAFLNHEWLAPTGGFTADVDTREHRPYRPCLIVRRADTPAVVARVYLDPETMLPARYSVFAPTGEVLADLDDWKDVGGAKVSGRYAVARFAGGYAVTAATATAAREPGSFAAPPPAADTTFDPAAPAVEARLVKGLLFVRPTVNGKRAPWLAVASNSTSTGLTAAAATRLGLPAFGKTVIVGVADMPARFRAVERLTLGAATTRDLVVMELADAGVAGQEKLLGAEVGGFIGSDVLARLVLEVDYAAGTAAVHDPAAYRPKAGVAWEPAKFCRGAPFVAGAFEGKHAGPFAFATGWEGVLMFTPAAVRGLDLLAGRTGEAAGLYALDGVSAAFGTTGAEFRTFGRTVRPVPCRFLTGPFGFETYPYALGVFGPATLGPGTVVLDYPNRRIGFAPKP